MFGKKPDRIPSFLTRSVDPQQAPVAPEFHPPTPEFEEVSQAETEGSEIGFEVAKNDIDNLARSAVAEQIDPTANGKPVGQPIDEHHADLTGRMADQLRRNEKILEEEIREKLDRLRRTQKARRGYERAHKIITGGDTFVKDNELSKEFDQVVIDGEMEEQPAETKGA